MIRVFCVVAAIAAAALPSTGQTEEIIVTNYGVTANSFPYIVALEKKFFQKAGADVTGILTADGGGSTVRNMLSGKLAFGDASFAAVAQAFLQGADIRIIGATNNTVGELYLAARPQLGMKELADIKGKKLGYTQPKSTTQAVTQVLVDVAGLKQSDVETLRTGGAGQTVVALDNNLIDAALIQEPLWSEHKSKYTEIAAAAEVLPPLAENFAIATAQATEEKGDFLRGVLKGRRMAIEFMKSNPDESAAIIAKTFKMSPEVIKSALANMMTPRKGLPYYGEGEIRMDAIKNMSKALLDVKAIDAEPDWSKLIDQSFLDDDLKLAQ